MKRESEALLASPTSDAARTDPLKSPVSPMGGGNESERKKKLKKVKSCRTTLPTTQKGSALSTGKRS